MQPRVTRHPSNGRGQSRDIPVARYNGDAQRIHPPVSVRGGKAGRLSDGTARQGYAVHF
jgi:hypothetical protein